MTIYGCPCPSMPWLSRLVLMLGPTLSTPSFKSILAFPLKGCPKKLIFSDIVTLDGMWSEWNHTIGELQHLKSKVILLTNDPSCPKLYDFLKPFPYSGCPLSWEQSKLLCLSPDHDSVLIRARQHITLLKSPSQRKHDPGDRIILLDHLLYVLYGQKLC